jgi:glycosyltransferase involved in cell wall biosynthesis
VSVLIPTYNRAALLPRAVRSALACTRPGDEILIADDASTDDTEQALAPFRDHLRYLKLPHGGAGATRNRAVAAATKPLVAFLDSDDEWVPDKLLLQRTLLERRPHLLFCFSDFVSREADGREVRNYLRVWHGDPRGWDEILGPGTPFSALAGLPPGRADFRVHEGSIYLAEMESDYVATTTVVVRREAAGAALRFADDLVISEDKECFARLAAAGPAAYLDCETSWQCAHPGPRLTDVNVHALASARLTLLDRIWGRDEAFRRQYGDRLERARRAQHLKRARWLLARGRTAEARGDLRQTPGSPLSYRLLAALPGPVVRGLLGLRRLVRGGEMG